MPPETYEVADPFDTDLEAGELNSWEIGMDE